MRISILIYPCYPANPRLKLFDCDGAALDLWSKEIAPSTELRKWFHREGEGADWKEFRRGYLTD